jgi:hypothetical protein
MIDQLSPIGDYSKPKVKGYYFDIDKWVYPFENVVDNTKVTPKNYFITSGEAIIKSSVLEEDLWSQYTKLYKHCIGILREHYEHPNEAIKSGLLADIDETIQKCLNSCWKSACQSTYLTINLIEARGTCLFLETDWYGGLITCYPKNPRGIKF